MKKYLSRLLTLAVIVPALVSCMEQLQDNRTQAKKHTVYFSTVVEHATKTGLTVADGTVTPDWRVTDPEDVHFFEMNGTSSAHMGVASDITPYDGDLGAHFKADIEQEITIIVNPPDNPTGDGQKVLRSGSYTYGAVVAKMRQDGDDPVFYIPAIQKPVAETLKDPGAEFLVGYSRDGYDALTIDEEGTIVDLYFDRVAALSRIGFSEFQGTNEKVMSVKINSATSMTGSVTANAISFGNPNSVTFTPDEGAGVLTLDYGTGVSVTDETFYAYFVSMPGTFDITSIEILTDQYRYTKEINKEGGFEFTLTELKNLKLTGATAEKVTQERVYTKVTSTADLEVDTQYLLVYETSSKAFKPILNSGGTYFTKSTDNALDVTISDGVIRSSDLEECEITLEEGYYLYISSASKYLYPGNSGDSALGAEDKTTGHTVAISFDSNGIVTIARSGDSNYHLYWSSSKYFSGINSNGSSYAPNICLYKLDDGREPQELSFSSENAEYDLYSSTWTVAVPTLSGVQTSATYALSEDSDPEVATVDASTGEVTVGTKTGTVTIVATAAGNNQYKPGSASYTLTVVNNDPNVNVYRKVTSTADLEVGAQYLLVFEGRPEDESADNHNPKVFKPILETSSSSTFTKSTNNALDVVILASTISSNEYEDYHLTLETGYYLKVDKYTKYLYPSYTTSGTSQRGTLNAESSASNALNISFNDGIVQIKTTSGSWYFVWSTSSHYFSASQDVEGDYSTGICLYKLDDGRQPQTLSFTPATATYDLYSPSSFVKPTLSTAYGDVTYSSDDDTIAEVDDSGNITGKKVGKVTITATAAGNTQYKPASVSYELTVVNNDPNVKVYRKVTSTAGLEVGAQYLLVFEGLAGDTDGDGDPKVFVPTLASNGDSFNKQKADALDVVITSGTITSNDYIAGHLTLETGYFLKVDAVGKYIYPIGSSGSGSIGAEASGSHNLTISFNAGIAQILNGTGYLVWSISSHYFSANTAVSGQYSTGICLYKLDDGRQPQTLSFTPATATYDLYTPSDFVKPTLSTAYGDVTYSSSDETIAEVDNSGNITGKKKGTVTITATAAGNTQYKPGSATYELTVVDNTPVQTETVQLQKATAITAGKQYVLVSNGKALVRNEDNAADVVDFNASSLTVTVSTALRNNLEWTLQSSSNLFKNGDYYFGIIMHATGTYTYRVALSTTTTNIDNDSNDSMPNLTINATDDYIYYTGNSSAYFLYFNSDDAIWTTYKITKANSYTHSYKTALYEVVDTRTPQNLEFSALSAEYDLGTSSWTHAVPSLSGYSTTVTYTSSDPTVATVNRNTGAVSINTNNKKGETIITATAEGNATYQPGEASYTLTVKNSLSTEAYVRVTSTDQIVNGGKYVIVYESGETVKAFKPVLNSGKTAFETSDNAIDVTITNNEIAPSAVEGCQIVLANQDGTSLKFSLLVPKADGETDYYFFVRGSSSNFQADASQTGYRSTLALDSSGVLTLTRTASNTTYNFRYSATNSAFQTSSSNASSNLYLFKLTE